MTGVQTCALPISPRPCLLHCVPSPSASLGRATAEQEGRYEENHQRGGLIDNTQPSSKLQTQRGLEVVFRWSGRGGERAGCMDRASNITWPWVTTNTSDIGVSANNLVMSQAAPVVMGGNKKKDGERPQPASQSASQSASQLASQLSKIGRAHV